jgi:hypothetical protein
METSIQRRPTTSPGTSLTLPGLWRLSEKTGQRLTERALRLHRLAQIMVHDSLDTTMIYIQATREDLQGEVEKIAWR